MSRSLIPPPLRRRRLRLFSPVTHNLHLLARFLRFSPINEKVLILQPFVSPSPASAFSFHLLLNMNVDERKKVPELLAVYVFKCVDDDDSGGEGARIYISLKFVFIKTRSH
jgi:hypothetical protein